MHVIIPSTGMDTHLCPLSEPISKTLIPINGKPVLQHILDELYSYMEYIGEIVIVKKNSEDVKRYVCNTSNIDPSFKERIHVVESKQANHKEGEEYFFMDDFYSGLEHLVDVVRVPMDDILLWRGDVLAIDTLKLSDMTLPSFACVDAENNPVHIYKFTDFVLSVNINVRQNNQKEEGHSFSIGDFIKEYEGTAGKLETLSDFGNLLRWQDPDSFYKAQSEFIARDSHTKYNIEIDAEKQQITKTNKYVNEDYDRCLWEKVRYIQGVLFSESSALSIPDAEQKIFLPEIVETGILQRGNFIDTLTEEYISGVKLNSFMTDQKLSYATWERLLDKVLKIINEVFHKNTMSYYDIRNELVDPKIIKDYVEKTKKFIIDTVNDISRKFTINNMEEYYYVMSCQEQTDLKIFAENLCNDVENHVREDNVFYQGSINRMIHGNISFDNILCDAFTSTIHFINPVIKEHQLSCKWIDYSYLYYSAVTGVHQICKGMYQEKDGVITIEKDAHDVMIDCERILDTYFTTNESDFYKRFALIILLDKIVKNDFKPELASTLLKYTQETIRSIYWKRIVG